LMTAVGPPPCATKTFEPGLDDMRGASGGGERQAYSSFN
jgi:hypothetical protein